MSSAPAPKVPPTAQGVADLPEVLSREQAAWLLQLTLGRLDAAARRGEIPARTFGHQRQRRLYSKTALIELVRNAAQQPHAQRPVDPEEDDSR